MTTKVSISFITLTSIRQALYEAKFALEQQTEGPDKERALESIRVALDLTSPYAGKVIAGLDGPGNESNPLLVDTLSTNLADPFGDEQPTTIKEPKK